MLLRELTGKLDAGASIRSGVPVPSYRGWSSVRKPGHQRIPPATAGPTESGSPSVPHNQGWPAELASCIAIAIASPITRHAPANCAQPTPTFVS
jgi:hypothetical protein